MGELSEQNRALMERILRGVLGYYPNALAAALDDPGGADLEPEDFNIILDAARSEGPSPGYDGGKSLGERLYEAVIAEDGPGAGWRGLECFPDLNAEDSRSLRFCLERAADLLRQDLDRIACLERWWYSVPEEQRIQIMADVAWKRHEAALVSQ